MKKESSINNELGNKDNTLLPAVNFTDFCKKADLEQIKKAIIFYNEPFTAEKVLDYFANWTIVYDDSQYRHGKILTNKHSTESWQTTITINDDAEYMFADDDNWQYLPKTFSEFISDVLRYQDFDLLLSENGRNKIYGQKKYYRPNWIESDFMLPLGYKLVSDKDGYLKYESYHPVAKCDGYGLLGNGMRVIYFNTTYSPIEKEEVFVGIKTDGDTRTCYNGVCKSESFLLELIKNVR